MRVLLTGGGTAGHVNPALAIAETVKRNCPDAEIEFVGVRNGKEADLIPREGYRLHFVESRGIRRSLSPSNIKALWLVLTSPRAKATQKILDDFSPDIVIGTGGYASWPIMKAASLRGIPTAVHESNAKPGKAIYKLRNHVDRVWINFDCTEALLKVKDPKKVLQVGNPLRNGFGALSREEARQRLGIDGERRMVLSFGGSMGAEEVNRAVIRMMADYSSQHPEILHIHATGTRDFATTSEEFRRQGLHEKSNCILTEYIYDMPLRMAAADVVISRAGAMTLSELALMGKASILIPSPHVAGNHQYRNAKELADAGAALLVEESALRENALTETVEALLGDESRQREMEQKVRAFANPDANRIIWNDILNLIKK
ncbi:MAG: UDP-N-acetylglucosamine--N-acetylmuramyl-(pentapeptide) pyrophosphoryl-undecaprenol N-acetylglucosamine transferase [Clostridia bacterium]|nr:UDP-N-acetylglucosamine--N-acetylmuramyl-(pentapeptide) pyrophosphoryl-undecaprenol N-acetylglucosamine transferase [Clostridia bacterium]